MPGFSSEYRNYGIKSFKGQERLRSERMGNDEKDVMSSFSNVNLASSTTDTLTLCTHCCGHSCITWANWLKTARAACHNYKNQLHTLSFNWKFWLVLYDSFKRTKPFKTEHFTFVYLSSSDLYSSKIFLLSNLGRPVSNMGGPVPSRPITGFAPCCELSRNIIT